MAASRWDEERVDRIISLVLRIGVTTASVLVALGAVVYLARHGIEPARYGTFQGEPESLRRITGIAESAATFHGSAIIQAGLIVLILTPIARVVCAAITFALQRDRLYVVVAFIVLAVLLGSLISGYL
jgi:uncharacterized membrane protein